VLFSIGLLSMVLFVELGIIGKSGPMPIDTTVALWFKAHRTAGEIRWAEVISAMTTPIIVLGVVVLILLFLNYWTRAWYLQDFMPLALVALAALISTVSGPFFNRLRPGAGLTTRFDFEPSYPSSHVVFMGAAGCALLLFATRRKFLIFVAVSFVTVSIGIALLILGVNWFTCIIGATFLLWGLLIIFNVLDEWLTERETSVL
jgi:membrane-associated phospholipid phosphatase